MYHLHIDTWLTESSELYYSLSKEFLFSYIIPTTKVLRKNKSSSQLVIL